MIDTDVTIIDLLRHGKPDGGEIFRGSTDVPLSDEGYQQMQASVAKLEPADVVITSPMLRCAKFASEVASLWQCDVQEENKLREIFFGDWEGELIADIAKKQAKAFELFWQNPHDNPPPNGEPLALFQKRVNDSFNQHVANYRGKKMLMVCHGGVIRAILADILKTPALSLLCFDVPYACISQIRIYHSEQGDLPQLVFHNL